MNEQISLGLLLFGFSIIGLILIYIIIKFENIPSRLELVARQLSELAERMRLLARYGR